MSANKARIIAVLGASGSGKSAQIKYGLLKPAATRHRLIVWDFKREYGAFVQHTTDNLSELVKRVSKARFSVAFQPSLDPKVRAVQFAFFCRLAIGLQRCTVVVEELKFVTSPSYSPPDWSMITCTGRHDGLFVIGTSQRPAQIDKDFLGNATMIYCGRLQVQSDVRTMADILFVEKAELMQLQELEYIQRDLKTHQNTRGKVKFRTAA